MDNKKTRQQFLDNDMIAEKRRDYMGGPHGVGQNTPGGEMESPHSQIIDHNADLPKPDSMHPNSGGITLKGDI